MSVERWSDWLSVEDAAEILGVSSSTLKRRLRASQPVIRPDSSSVEAQGERVERPQGWTWQVRLPSDLVPLPTDQTEPDSEEAPPISSGQDSDQTALGTLRDMVVLERAERQRVTNENATLRERIGRTEAERDALVAALARERAASEAIAAERDAERRKTWWDKLMGR